MWTISIIGIRSPNANDLAKETPTSKDPNNPGPLVKATADISFLSISASVMAWFTTGIIFC